MANKDGRNQADSDMLEDVDREQSPHQRSATAKEIADLQDRILKLAHNRERLPQPLFWSLFNSRIHEIKKNKELERLLNDVLG
jgi:hypothetical protein